MDEKLERELTWKDEEPLLWELTTRAAVGDAVIRALKQVDDEEAQEQLSAAIWSDTDGETERQS